ncbi:MAG: HIT domain-containing protein [Deltaproteobacteria bacterium]|nr:HIT domain-containing protein [Deltaproteobacteria bacterium]
MKVLWAPWRMTLLSAPKPKGCIFCHLPRSDDLRGSLVLAATRSALVMLNRYPYNSGHLMVAPRRHVASLDRLTRPQRGELQDALVRTIEILRRELAPEGMNVGMNLGAVAGAGIADHLHWHVVPRWTGDTNFMPAIGSVKVMPQHLLDTYDRLHAAFDSLRRDRRRRRARR